MPDIKWDELGFSLIRTNCHAEYRHVGGKWDSGELKSEPTITLSIGATCLHYGQAAFEGLKAFSCVDGKIRVFRDDENAKRMNAAAAYLHSPAIPSKLFHEAVDHVVAANAEFIPPYGTGGSLYIRPLLIGSGAGMGVHPSDEHTFIVMATPVGNYYKGGITPVDAIILDDFDRAAPSGSGRFKVAGNYAASFMPSHIARSKGFPINLYLDSKTHQFVDEFGTSNFIAISKEGHYITPESASILPSITNKSLMQLAEDMGIPTERRPIRFDEVPGFAEVGACGTAVVITPIRRIVRQDKVYEFGNECGPLLRKLHDKVKSIQYGESPDTHGWLREIKV